MPSSPTGSLALLLGALGDTILALPALAALARAAPPLHLWGPAPERLRLLTGPRGPAAGLIEHPWAGALPLFGAGAPEDTPCDRLLQAHRRVVAFAGPGALARGIAIRGGVSVAPPRADEPLRGHAGDVLAERFRVATGLEVAGPPRLAPAPDDAARGRRLAGAADYVVCHPGSGGRLKRWPGGEFARVLAGLPHPAVVVTGPAEAEWPVEVALGALRTVECPDLAALTALLAGARAYLGNDSGPTHLAAALGTPTLALFGPTDPARWGPRGPGACRVVRASPPGGDRPVDTFGRLDPAGVLAAARDLAQDPSRGDGDGSGIRWNGGGTIL